MIIELWISGIYVLRKNINASDRNSAIAYVQRQNLSARAHNLPDRWIIVSSAL